MQKTNSWFRPYILNPHNIEKIVQPGKPGVFVLGNMDQDKKFRIKHIRSSSDVKTQLRESVGKYHVFMYKPLKFQLDSFQGQQQKLQLA